MSSDLPSNTDGRVARRQRTQRAIVAAHLALLEEGDLSPTGERIAARAGVSLRTFWLNFRDMNLLLGAAAEAVYRRMQGERRPIDPGGTLQARIDAYCRERARLLEVLTPFARASMMRSPKSAVLREYEERYLRDFAQEIEAVFAQELPVEEPLRRRYVQALTVATTWAAWSMSRELLGLDVAEATAVLERTLTDLLRAACALRDA